MRANNDLLVIELPMQIGGHSGILNLSVILDSEKGHTLVDAGMPGQENLILEQLAQEGIEPADLKRIVLTHQDMDHIGSLKALKDATGATVLALDVEVPYIDGSKPLGKISPERLAQMPELKAIIDGLQRCAVDVALKDGEVLDIAGGVTVVATPGHTPGHASLYLNRSRCIIAGDAMTSWEGALNGPNEAATPDLSTAKDSVRKLAELEVDQVLCYHGGLVDKDAAAQLDKVAAA